MKLAVIKPAYFADIGLLAKTAAADLVVWADTFMFSRHSTVNRARIKTAEGAQWLTAAVVGGEGMDIGSVRLKSSVSPHCKTLEVNYQNSPYYFFLADEVNELLQKPQNLLNRLCKESFLFLCRNMAVSRPMVDASALSGISDRTKRVIAWLQETGCDEYLFEEHEASLIRSNEIQDRGFRLKRLVYEAPRYHQLFGDFIPNLSGLDLLFNEGEQSRCILKRAVQVVGLL